MVAVLHVHPSRADDLREPDDLVIQPQAKASSYLDSYGNRCTRFQALRGTLRLSCRTLIQDSGDPDAVDFNARELPVNELPHETLRYLLNSRYCEVDRLSNIAADLFGAPAAGLESRAGRLRLGPRQSGLRIPAYAAPPRPRWMFLPSAWACAATFSIWPSRFAALSIFRRATPPDTWAISASRPLQTPWTSVPGSRFIWKTAGGRSMPATIIPRIGRVLMATGRDASDVAITTSFGGAASGSFSW